MTNRRWSLLSIVLLAGLAAGCVSIQTRATREYLLTWRGEIPADFERGAPTAARGDSIAIGPVVVPAYLQRAGIVTRIGDNRINASTEHTWGEALEAGIARMLVESVAKESDSNRVARMPWPFPGAPELRVAVEILNFEYDQESDSISLVTRWTVLDGSRARAKLVRREVFELPLENDDYSSIVDGMSDLVLDLGAEIASDLERLKTLREGDPNSEAPR